MQVAAAALLFYLSSDKRQRRCFFCQIAAAPLLFLPNSGSAATFQVAGAQLCKLYYPANPKRGGHGPMPTPPKYAPGHQLWQVNPHFHYRGDQLDWEPIGSLRWFCWRGKRRGTKHFRGTQAGDKRGLMKGLRGPIGSQWGKRLIGICRSSNG